MLHRQFVRGKTSTMQKCFGSALRSRMEKLDSFQIKRLLCNFALEIGRCVKTQLNDLEKNNFSVTLQ